MTHQTATSSDIVSAHQQSQSQSQQQSNDQPHKSTSLESRSILQPLIEDVHQGRTTPSAQATIDRYREFVQQRNAPIARMNYTPFTKSDTGRKRAVSMIQPQRGSLLDQQVPASRAHAHSASESSFPRIPSPSQYQLQQQQQQSSSRRSSTSSTHVATPIPKDLDPPTTIEPGLLTTKVGGAAWNIDLPDWSSAKVGSASSSKPGSRSGSKPTSRKSSMNWGSSRKSSFSLGNYGSLGREGHTRIRSGTGPLDIWSATTNTYNSDAMNSHRRVDSYASKDSSASTPKEESSSEASHHLSRTNEVLSYRDREKRLSLNQPQNFLRAHANDAKYGLLATRLQHNSTLTPPRRSKNLLKRASMPPLQNRRGLGLLPNSNVNTVPKHPQQSVNSRRGSMIGSLKQDATNSVSAGAFRNRSKSLPSDTLFTAYSSCALPTVMTSSLAAMPVPSQPAIPVSVARRYSILAPQEMEQVRAASDQSMSAATKKKLGLAITTPVAAATATEEVINVDPSAVPGIDTSSVLDTSQLQDIQTEQELQEEEDNQDESADAVQASLPIIGGRHSRRGSQFTPLSVSTSTYQTPMASPVPTSQQISPSAYPLSTTSHLEEPKSIVPPGQSLPMHGRSRSSIHSTHSLSGLPRLVPSMDQQLAITTVSDCTPLTSPTNLSHAVFKDTLIKRRMSEVVAKDIAKKLQVLKKHIKEDEKGDNEDEEGHHSFPPSADHSASHHHEHDFDHDEDEHIEQEPQRH